MNKDDLKEYFEKFFENYQPYRNNKVYNTIIDKLFNNYFDDSYNTLPSSFKEAYENQKIPLDFYNNILLSVGFTQDILNKLSYKDKEILLKTFTNFNIYKGTLNQIQRIASDFEEELNLYELLIDFRTVLIPYYHLTFLKNQDYVIAENELIYESIKINDYLKIPGDSNQYRVVIKKELNKIYIDKPFDITTVVELHGNKIIDNSLKINNVEVNRWVFVPDLIYAGEKVKNQVINKFLDYDSIYDNTRKYFISIESLELQKDELVLPIKSNLILIDYKKYRNINLLNYLFAAILLKTYRKSRMVIYFKDGNYLTNLERITKLWYYIIYRFYNKAVTTNGLPNESIIFSISNPNFNLEIKDIPKILEEYNNIETQYEISLLYNKYISKQFYSLIYNDSEQILNLDQFKLLMEDEIGTDLIEYVEKRIFNAQGVDSEFECDFILDELQSSVLTWAYTNEIAYIDYLTDSLSYISASVDFSPTYNLILFLKPYHVEIIKQSGEILEINNKFNLVNPYHKRKFFIDLYKASILTLTHRLLNSKIISNINDNVIITSTFKNNLIHLSKQILLIIDSYLKTITYFEESVEFQSHDEVIYLKNILYSFINIIGENLITVLKEDKEFLNNENKIKLLVGGEVESLLNTSINRIFDISVADFDSSGRNLLDTSDFEVISKKNNSLLLTHTSNIILEINKNNFVFEITKATIDKDILPEPVFTSTIYPYFYNENITTDSSVYNSYFTNRNTYYSLNNEGVSVINDVFTSEFKSIKISTQIPQDELTTVFDTSLSDFRSLKITNQIPQDELTTVFDVSLSDFRSLKITNQIPQDELTTVFDVSLSDFVSLKISTQTPQDELTTTFDVANSEIL